jgi:hypothetical protein
MIPTRSKKDLAGFHISTCLSCKVSMPIIIGIVGVIHFHNTDKVKKRP